MKFLKTLGLILILLLVLIGVGYWFFERTPAKPVNEQLFTNGTIYIDVDKKVTNLLVKDGLVAAYDVNPKKYRKAQVIDLKGTAAYPGFNDSHVHLLESGYTFYVGLNMIGVNNDVAKMAKMIKEKAKTLPAGAPILGGGFSLRDYDKWTLKDLAAIDAAAGGHPVFIGDKLGHNAVINSATMKLVGLTAKTPVPVGGKVIVQKGKPTGMLRESAMNLAGNKLYSLADPKDLKAGTTQAARQWASTGYTGIVDLMGATGFRIMFPETFKAMEADGTLPLRVNYCYTIYGLSDVDAAAKYVGQDTELVRFLGCKIFVDGAFAGGQAWTTWKNKQGKHGLQEYYTDDKGGQNLNLNRIVAKVEEAGMNMHYHAQGDRAISAVLDALDKVVAAKGQLKGIHTLIHVAFPTDAEIARIKKFAGHVVVTTQPGFWPVEDDTAYYYGDRAKTAYPVKKMIDSGLSVGISTDFAVSPPEYSPASIVIGVASTGGGDPQDHPPVSVKEMIRGLTVGSAKTTGRDDTGTLEVGKKADIVVYETDLLAVPPEKFTASYPKVLSTYLGGKKVYDAAAVAVNHAVKPAAPDKPTAK